MEDVLIIQLNDVPVTTHIGVPETERATPQTLLISLSFAIADPPSFARDSTLPDTIDYAALIAFLQAEIPARGPWVLVESVAESIIEYALSLSARVAWADVQVKKPSVLGSAGMTSVSLRRSANPARRRLGLSVTEAQA
jgi:FolB domain-containing protein